MGAATTANVAGAPPLSQSLLDEIIKQEFEETDIAAEDDSHLFEDEEDDSYYSEDEEDDSQLSEDKEANTEYDSAEVAETSSLRLTRNEAPLGAQCHYKPRRLTDVAAKLAEQRQKEAELVNARAAIWAASLENLETGIPPTANWQESQKSRLDRDRFADALWQTFNRFQTEAKAMSRSSPPPPPEECSFVPSSANFWQHLDLRWFHSRVLQLMPYQTQGILGRPTQSVDDIKEIPDYTGQLTRHHITYVHGARNPLQDTKYHGSGTGQLSGKARLVAYNNAKGRANRGSVSAQNQHCSYMVELLKPDTIIHARITLQLPWDEFSPIHGTMLEAAFMHMGGALSMRVNKWLTPRTVEMFLAGRPDLDTRGLNNACPLLQGARFTLDVCAVESRICHAAGLAVRLMPIIVNGKSKLICRSCRCKIRQSGILHKTEGPFANPDIHRHNHCTNEAVSARGSYDYANYCRESLTEEEWELSVAWLGIRNEESEVRATLDTMACPYCGGGFYHRSFESGFRAAFPRATGYAQVMCIYCSRDHRALRQKIPENEFRKMIQELLPLKPSSKERLLVFESYRTGERVKCHYCHVMRPTDLPDFIGQSPQGDSTKGTWILPAKTGLDHAACFICVSSLNKLVAKRGRSVTDAQFVVARLAEVAAWEEKLAKNAARKIILASPSSTCFCGKLFNTSLNGTPKELQQYLTDTHICSQCNHKFYAAQEQGRKRREAMSSYDYREFVQTQGGSFKENTIDFRTLAKEMGWDVEIATDTAKVLRDIAA